MEASVYEANLPELGPLEATPKDSVVHDLVLGQNQDVGSVRTRISEIIVIRLLVLHPCNETLTIVHWRETEPAARLHLAGITRAKPDTHFIAKRFRILDVHPPVGNDCFWRDVQRRWILATSAIYIHPSTRGQLENVRLTIASFASGQSHDLMKVLVVASQFPLQILDRLLILSPHLGEIVVLFLLLTKRLVKCPSEKQGEGQNGAHYERAVCLPE